MSDKQDKLIVFQEKAIRRVWHKEEWFFSVVDCVALLIDDKEDKATKKVKQQNPRRYWSDTKRRLKKEGFEVYDFIVQLKMEATDGKMRKTDVANTEAMFRIIQSIPSKKAEPLKRWLAKVGYERIQEIENPELAAERARQYYRDLGYDEKWIETRIQSIAVRGQLTDEWKDRGVAEGMEYAILTAEISKATFGLKPSEHKAVKDLNRENLRDHMTNLELIFTMLGEESTKQKAVEVNAQGFDENREAAKEGGEAAGDALEAYEKRTGKKVVSEQNFKDQIKAAKKQKRLEAKKNKDKK